MNEINDLFRNRIGYSEQAVITFSQLPAILERIAKTIPFENVCVVTSRPNAITRESLVDKILAKNEGGLCYELNGLLYFFLLENGFQTELVRGVVYNQGKEEWSATGRSHVTNLITYEGRLYVVDAGFGGNVPLAPVPLSGETVSTANGEFRVRGLATEHGDYVLDMKLKHKDKDWKLGYAFDSKQLSNWSELNDIQNIILTHPGSSLNKHPLMTRLTDQGNVTLTDTSFTEWRDGEVRKEEIDEERFRQLMKEHFQIESV